MVFLLWLLLSGVARAQSGNEYEVTLTGLTVSLGGLLLIWQHKSKLVPNQIPADSKAQHRPRPIPMSQSAPQPDRLPESGRFEEVSRPEPRAPIALPPEQDP